MTRCRWPRLVGTCAVLLTLVGCGSDEAAAPVESLDPPVRSLPRAEDDDGPMTPERLRELLGVDESVGIATAGGEIRAVDLRGQDVADIGPLQGLPLKELFLEDTGVEDIAALAGMELETLYLSETAVSDLTPLEGAPLKQLNLVGSRVADLSPLSEFDGEILWMRDTPVTNLSPLAGASMKSLDVQDTGVIDLTPVREINGLQRLNIAGTKVTDLTPLKGLSLTRLIFTPANIETGLDVVRGMSSLTELDVEYESGQPLGPREFWEKYDAGEFEAK